MDNLKHIFLGFAAVTILFPTAVNFAHLLSNHEHEVCTNYADKHFHGKSLDCESYKFQQNPALELSFFNFEPKPEKTANYTHPNHYTFLSEQKKLSFELRGPPLS